MLSAEPHRAQTLSVRVSDETLSICSRIGRFHDVASGILIARETGVLGKRGGQLNNRDPRTRDRAIPVGERVGSFRYLRAEDRWEWSDAVAHMHGHALPTTALVMSHKHPDDAAYVANRAGFPRECISLAAPGGGRPGQLTR